ncbi:MAG: NADH-quinone oxidoreductase subunit M, partial [Gammaproteobacteria bacterium]|nr:NADH-quinone oxidoreductase subunit M [Gammaproteobacteria bacterium]
MSSMIESMFGLSILSVLVWLPIIGGIVLLGLGRRDGQSGGMRLDRIVALAISVLTFVLSLPLWTNFDSSTASMQFVERVPWIRTFNVEYYLGIDGFSMPLILLTTFLTPIVVLAGWEVIEKRTSQYFAAFLILEG